MNIALRVVSFCHYLQGPGATQYLADLGADVIKVEPLRGAFERHWSGAGANVDGVSAFHLAVNRNKRSFAIDLKKPEALDAMLRIIDRADVVVENFRPGVMDRLGLGYDALRARKPDIIYASATGLGATGPASKRPGQDLLMQARSGLVAVTGSRESGPTNVGAAVVDQHGASLLAMGILAAFARKQQTGQGARVETSLFQAGIDLQAEALAYYHARPGAGDVVSRGPNVGSWYHEAPYGTYALADCEIVISMNDPGRVAEALDSDALRAFAGADLYEERERYAEAVAREVAGFEFAALAERFEAAGVWYERVQSYDDLAADPQAEHLGAFVATNINGRRARLVAHPLRYDGVCPEIRRFPLEVGCDGAEILAEHGFEPAEIDRLVERGVVGLPPDAGSGPRGSQEEGRRHG